MINVQSFNDIRRKSIPRDNYIKYQNSFNVVIFIVIIYFCCIYQFHCINNLEAVRYSQGSLITTICDTTLLVVVVFIPLYTLAGFYICSLLQCFSSYFHLHLSCFQNFSFIIFHFYISYIFHIFHRLDRFFRLFFSSNVLSSSFPKLFLPTSFQLSCLSVGHHIFPIRGQLFNSNFFCQMSLSQFSSLLDCFSAFAQNATYFAHVMYLFHSCHVHQLSNSKFSPCLFFSLFPLFQFPFFLSIVSEFPYPLSILGIPFKM